MVISTNTRFVVFVESNTTGNGQRYVEVARQLGFEPRVLVADATRYPWLSDLPAVVVVADTSCLDSVVSACRRIGLDGTVEAVLSSSDYFVEIAARAASALGVGRVDPDDVARCRRKDLQRSVLERAHIAIPIGASVSDADEAVRAAGSIGLPVVVKPADGSGSVGVRVCETFDEVEHAVNALFADSMNERGIERADVALVEEYIRGIEYSVEIIGGAPWAIVRKHLSEPPMCIEVGHDVPAPLAPKWRRPLLELAMQASEALGLTANPLHVELRVRDGRPYVIEVNPRLAGGRIPELLELCTGSSPHVAVLMQSIGMPETTAPTMRCAASIRFLLADRSGRIDSVVGIDAAQEIEGVVSVDNGVEVGSNISLNGDFRDRVASVIAVSPNADGSSSAAETAAALLRVEIAEVVPA